jgi:thiosulfate dehydrogenase [quinone] large subunit
MTASGMVLSFGLSTQVQSTSHELSWFCLIMTEKERRRQSQSSRNRGQAFIPSEREVLPMSSSAGDLSTSAVESSAAVANQSQAPVTLGERSLVAMAVVRIFFGFLWFQQISWKMPPDYSGLRADVVREVHYTILPGYSSIIQNVFLTHFSILGACIWTAELVIGTLLLLGVFTRLGAALALLLSIQLYVGIAYAPNEWYWGYGMLLMLSLTLLVIPAGRRLGIDQILQSRLSQAAKERWLARLLLRFI